MKYAILQHHFTSSLHYQRKDNRAVATESFTLTTSNLLEIVKLAI